jgi:hypothetical protein
VGRGNAVPEGFYVHFSDGANRVRAFFPNGSFLTDVYSGGTLGNITRKSRDNIVVLSNNCLFCFVGNNALRCSLCVIYAVWWWLNFLA